MGGAMDLTNLVRRLRANGDDAPGTVDAWHEVHDDGSKRASTPW